MRHLSSQCEQWKDRHSGRASGEPKGCTKIHRVEGHKIRRAGEGAERGEHCYNLRRDITGLKTGRGSTSQGGVLLNLGTLAEDKAHAAVDSAKLSAFLGE